MIHTITAPPPVTPERMHGGHPILQPSPAHSWESHVVLNPAATLVTDADQVAQLAQTWSLTPEARAQLAAAGGCCVLLYRAQGASEPDKRHAPSYLGLALFTPTLDLVYRHPEPVLRPEADFHNLGVEDARCTQVGDTFYLYYTGYSTTDYDGPAEDRLIQICLATTQNFRDWQLHGPVSGDVNTVPNKNAALFPKRIEGQWLLLHRPMAGEEPMAIHWAAAAAPEGPWHTLGALGRSRTYREFAKSWIGAGGPPISLGEHRYLMIYHQGHFTADQRREYDLAAGLLDFAADPIWQHRIEPLMRPVGVHERLGDAALGVDNVLFTCANYRWGDQLVIPYAGADSRIFGASIELAALMAALEAT